MLRSIGHPQQNTTFTPTAAELTEWGAWAEDKKLKEIHATIKEFDTAVNTLLEKIVSIVVFPCNGLGTNTKSVQLFAPESLSTLAGFKMFCVSEKNEECIEFAEKLFKMCQKYKTFPSTMGLEKVGFIYTELEKIYAVHLHEKSLKPVNLPADLLTILETVETLSPNIFIAPIADLQELIEGDPVSRLLRKKDAKNFMITNINNDKYFAEQKSNDEQLTLYFNMTVLLYHMDAYLQKMQDDIDIKKLDKLRNPDSKVLIPDEKNMLIVKKLYAQLNVLQNDKSKDFKTALNDFIQFHKTMFVQIMLLTHTNKAEANYLLCLQLLINPMKTVAQDLQKFLDSAGEKQHRFLLLNTPLDKCIDIATDLIKNLAHLQDQYMKKKSMTLVDYDHQVKAYYQKSAAKVHELMAKHPLDSQRNKLIEFLSIIQRAMGETPTQNVGQELIRRPVHVATVEPKPTGVSVASASSTTSNSVTPLSSTHSTTSAETKRPTGTSNEAKEQSTKRMSLTAKSGRTATVTEVVPRHSRAHSSASFISVSTISNALKIDLSPSADGESPRSRSNTVSTPVAIQKWSPSSHKASQSVAFNFNSGHRGGAMFIKKELRMTPTSATPQHQIRQDEEKVNTSSSTNTSGLKQ